MPGLYRIGISRQENYFTSSWFLGFFEYTVPVDRNYYYHRVIASAIGSL